MVISRDDRRGILEPCRAAWTPAFLDLAGAANAFPYPSDLPPVEPGPDFDE